MAQYIEIFERILNMMRRDNPSLPDDYLVTSSMPGLSDYIKAHLECHKPKHLQNSMWMV